MVREAACHLHEGGEPAAGPALPPAARGFGSTGQPLGQTSQLFGREAAGSPRVGPMPQSLWSPVAAARYPLADRSLADAQGAGDLTLGPTLLWEVPGLPASGFSPIVRWLLHASQWITALTKL